MKITPKPDSRYIENVYEYPTTGQNTMLVQTIDYIKALEPDFALFRQIVLYLQQFMKERFESG